MCFSFHLYSRITPLKNMASITNITYLNFGINRTKENPGIFFYAHCKSWEGLGPTKGRCKRDSCRFKCTAIHQSLMPIQNNKKWCRMKAKSDCTSSDIAIINSDNNNKKNQSIVEKC